MPTISLMSTLMFHQAIIKMRYGIYLLGEYKIKNQWVFILNYKLAVKLAEYYCNTCGAKMPEYLGKMIANFYKCDVGETSNKNFDNVYRFRG